MSPDMTRASSEIGYTSKKRIRMKGRDFLRLQDFSAEEVWAVLKLSKRLKSMRGRGRSAGKPLRGKNVVLLFEKPSTRTRVSFELAVAELGGTPIYLSRAESQLGRGETVTDTARVLSRYAHLIMARVYRFETLEELAEGAGIPVVNGLSDVNHPLQILADLLTMWERFGRLRGLRVAWVGDGNNVCNSLLVGASKLGISVCAAVPEGYEPDERFLGWARANAEATGAEIEIVREPEEAVEGADVVMTDVFVSMGQEEEREERLKVFYPKYRVDEELMAKASPNAIFMHPLPAHRGEEVVDEVIDGERSAVWEQAENRLHTAKALLSLLL